MLGNGVVPMGSRVDDLCKIAYSIWREHYPKLIGSAQVEYMLEKFQSPAAVRKQVKDGYDYFFLQRDGKDVGYCGVHPEPDTGKLFLSKIYVESAQRGKGVAKNAVKFLEEYAKKKGLKSIYLTVNKGNNGSIYSYLQMGFRIADNGVFDIGSGYVMDDYIMEKSLQ